jgi:TRAP-type C4-dicarboxylate transport system permease small subunit
MPDAFKLHTARALGALCIVIFLALVLVVLWGVATRYLAGHQAVWSEELARVLLVWLSMVGAALAYIENSHLGVDVLTRPMTPDARRIAHVVSHACVFLFAAGVMLWGGAELFLERWHSGQVMSAMQIRKAWFYLSVPVSGLLIALFALDAAVMSSRRSELPKGTDA